MCIYVSSSSYDMYPPPHIMSLLCLGCVRALTPTDFSSGIVSADMASVCGLWVCDARINTQISLSRARACSVSLPPQPAPTPPHPHPLHPTPHPHPPPPPHTRTPRTGPQMESAQAIDDVVAYARQIHSSSLQRHPNTARGARGHKAVPPPAQRSLSCQVFETSALLVLLLLLLRFLRSPRKATCSGGRVFREFTRG